MCESHEKETLRACKRLVNAISPWLYSAGRPPESLNKLILGWIDHRSPPTMAQVEQAIKEANEQHPTVEKTHARSESSRPLYHPQN